MLLSRKWSLYVLSLLFCFTKVICAERSLDKLSLRPSKREDVLSTLLSFLGIHTRSKSLNANNSNARVSADKVAEILGIDRQSIDLYAAYCGASLNITSDSWDCGVQCNLAETQGTVIKHRWSSEDVATSGYVAINPKLNIILIVYRGSVVTGDWVEDFTANLVDWPENVPGSRVGMGFLQGYQAANPKAIQTVADLAVEYPTYRIIVAGHSLGGARAGLLVAELLLGHPELKSRTMLFTYGQPKCGNAEFAEYMNKLGIPLIREVNKSDLVPHLPIPELGYVHFGTEVWALSDSQYIVCQSGDYAKCSENIEPAELNTKEHFQYKWML